MAADDDIVWPLIGNNDLVVASLAPKNDDDAHEDATVLFGIDVSSGSAPIDLDGGGGEGATATGTPVCSNDSTPFVATTSSGVGKRKSVVWADFYEIFEIVNGREICTKATYKRCKHTLSARSNAGIGHLKRHRKSCRQKTDQAARVQSRFAYNPNGSMHNWDYKPDVARSKLCCLIVRLDLPLGIGETET
jgi:hypothetical protein